MSATRLLSLLRSLSATPIAVITLSAKTALLTSLNVAGLVLGVLIASVFPANAQSVIINYVAFPGGTEVTCPPGSLNPGPQDPPPFQVQGTFSVSWQAPPNLCGVVVNGQVQNLYTFSFWIYADQMTAPANGVLPITATLQQGGPNINAYAWYLSGGPGPRPQHVETFAFSINQNQVLTPTPIGSVTPSSLWTPGSNTVSTNTSGITCLSGLDKPCIITINALPSLESFGRFAYWYLATADQLASPPPPPPLPPPSFSPALNVAPHSDYPLAIAFYLNCAPVCAPGFHASSAACFIPFRGVCPACACVPNPPVCPPGDTSPACLPK